MQATLKIAPVALVSAIARQQAGKRARGAASGEFDYVFEELPLQTEGPWCAGLLNGKATIAYHADETGSVDWFVHEIYLDAYRKLPGGGHEYGHVEVDQDANSQTYLAIWSELTDGSFKQHIEEKAVEKVREEMAYA